MSGPQTEPIPQKPSGTASTAVALAPADYKIGPGDVIDIKIEDAPELSGTFTIGSNGHFRMHFLGIVNADGKTADELEDVISAGLRGRYVVEPLVTVNVTQQNSRSFYIQGSVANPGLYQINIGEASLLKLIMIAGGLAPNHGSTAYVIREQVHSPAQTGAPVSPAATASDEKYKLIKADINGLLSGNFGNDIPIEPGDVVNIPPEDLYFVLGEVKAPGTFGLKRRTTVRHAISLAQGITPQASAKDAIIFRDVPGSPSQQEIKIDLARILKGKEQDIPLMANDVIMVPGSKSRTALRTVMGGIASWFLWRLPIPRL
jgi:polysaccharide export outer membrane protein